MTTPERPASPDEPRRDRPMRAERPGPNGETPRDIVRPRRRTSRAITPQVGTPVAPGDPYGFPLDAARLDDVVRAALREAGALEDIAVAACVVSGRRAHGTVIARRTGVVAGMPLAVAAFRHLDENVAIRVDADDGERVAAGAPLMRITGFAHGILSAERVALAFVRHLSGIATLTARYVDAVQGTGARIRDAGCTTPGLRELERYAARAGGALDGRRDDESLVRICENHLAAVSGDVALAVRRARELALGDALIEIACRTPADVRTAIDAGADAVVLAGVAPATLREAVRIAAGRAITEVAGPIGLDAVRALAETGVDRIAVSALTESPPSLEMVLEFEAA